MVFARLRRSVKIFFKRFGLLAGIGFLLIVLVMVFENAFTIVTHKHNDTPKTILKKEEILFTARNDEPKFPEIVDDRKFVIENLEKNPETKSAKVISIDNEESQVRRNERPKVVFEDMGKVNVHVWDSLCSFTINTVRQFPLFPLQPKSKTKLEIKDELNSKLDGSWLAQRVMGYLHPPVSGNYQFELSSFFMAELWLSVDEDPARAKLISKIARNKLYKVFFSIGENSPKSSPVKLNNGSAYYFEIIHVINDVKSKEDHVRLSWKMPDFNDFTSINKDHVSAYLVNEDRMSRNETQLKIRRSRSLVIVKEDDMSNETQQGFTVDIFKSIMSPNINTSSYHRDNVKNLPYWDRADFKQAIFEAPYEPSYTRKREFKRYEGVYNTHFTDVFPNDGTRLRKDGYKDPTERDGNTMIDEKEVFEVLKIFFTLLNRRFPK